MTFASSLGTASSSSVTVAFPAGTVAGDRVVVATGAHYGVGVPAGWTQIDYQAPGSMFSGNVVTKIVSASDITTGSVTIPLSGGAEPSAAVAFRIPGAAPVPLIIKAVATTGTATLTSEAEPRSGDSAVYAAFSRNSTTPTISRGTTVQSTSVDVALRVNIEDGPGVSGTTVTSTSAAASGGYHVHMYLRTSSLTITDPSDLPGLKVWASAEQAAADYADGATMTTWADQSGIGNNLTAVGTPIYRASGGPAGGKRIDIAPDEYFTLPSSLMSSATQGSAVLVLNPPSGNNGVWRFGTSADMSHYGYGGEVLDDFGSNARRSVGSYTAATWQRFMVSSKPGEWRGYINGAQRIASSTNTVAWRTSPLEVGRSGSAGWELHGSISLFLLYSQALNVYGATALDDWVAAHLEGGIAAGGGLITPISLADPLPAIQASLTLSTFTDTIRANRINGRIREGSFIDESVEPVAALPAHLTRAARYDKALAYPTPTLVDGRPT